MEDNNSIKLLAAPEIITPDGKHIAVPIDQSALRRLQELFVLLSATKQEWLLSRFPFCESDEEATELMNSRVAKPISHSTFRHWKAVDSKFREAYNLLASRLVDWAKYIATDLEAGNAVLGALESRKLLLTSWDKLDARGTSAKMQAAQASLDRVVGKKSEINIKVTKLTDLLPRRGGLDETRDAQEVAQR